MNRNIYIILSVFLVLLVISIGCAPGPRGMGRFAEHPAGFWAGLWHGLICVVTFVISLFTNNVQMYEVNNTGAWYNFGFLLGVCIIMAGGGGSSCKKKSRNERNWDEVAEKVERKILKGIKEWVEEDEKKDDDEWKEIGRRVEAKVKRELSDWADK